MEIKVLGTGCAGCRTLYETVTQAIAELGISAAIVKEEDIAEILSYGIMTPVSYTHLTLPTNREV